MAASRKWICVRLATYENEEEGALIQSFFRGRQGTLENTVVVLLDPDGEPLTRAGRGPGWLIGEGRGPDAVPGEGAAERLASYLDEHARPYEDRPLPGSLPLSLDFRRALNVASCDSRPLLVARAAAEEDLAALEQRLAALAWRDDSIGRFQFALVRDADALEALEGVPEHEGVYAVQPDRFGVAGTVLGAVRADASDEDWEALLAETLEAFTMPQKDARSHISRGRQQGVRWISEMPVTDPGARR